jgi:hypothetical protein
MLSLVIQCLIFAFGIYYFMFQSTLQNKLATTCQFCNDFHSTTDETTSSCEQHIDLRHNIFKFIGCFKHIMFLKESNMSLQHKRIRRMLEAKNVEVFN